MAGTGVNDDLTASAGEGARSTTDRVSPSTGGSAGARARKATGGGIGAFLVARDAEAAFASPTVKAAQQAAETSRRNKAAEISAAGAGSRREAAKLLAAHLSKRGSPRGKRGQRGRHGEGQATTGASRKEPAASAAGSYAERGVASANSGHDKDRGWPASWGQNPFAGDRVGRRWVPLHASNAKLVKSGKMTDLSFATYNCAGLSAERLSWLMGSQDGSQLGLMKDFLILTECQNKEQGLADLWGRHR